MPHPCFLRGTGRAKPVLQVLGRASLRSLWRSAQENVSGRADLGPAGTFRQAPVRSGSTWNQRGERAKGAASEPSFPTASKRTERRPRGAARGAWASFSRRPEPLRASARGCQARSRAAHGRRRRPKGCVRENEAHAPLVARRRREGSGPLHSRPSKRQKPSRPCARDHAILFAFPQIGKVSPC